MKPTIATLAGLYAAAKKQRSPLALERVRESIRRHGRSEIIVKVAAWLRRIFK